MEDRLIIVIHRLINVKKLLLFVSLFSAVLYTEAQVFHLTIKCSNEILKVEDYKKEFKTEAEARKEVNRIRTSMLSKGYISSTIDSIIMKGNEVTAYLYTGSIYTYGKISLGNTDEEALINSGYREKIYRKKIFYPEDIAHLAEKILIYYENNGFPFAALKFDSIHFEKDRFNAVLRITKNGFYKIDSIHIKGDAKTNPDYIHNYIQVKPGDIYDESVLKKIEKRLKEIPFVEMTKTPEIVFTKEKAELNLYLKKKKASQFNGILGVLPDNKTGKILITGDARIRLKNAFSKGELIDLNWRKLNNSVNDLKVNFNYPFLFKTSFGTDLNFKLYKKDSTFLELHKNAALQYLLRGGNYFKVFLTNNTYSLITPSMFENATTLPAFADVNNLMYGIGFKHEQLDYKLNPRKGFAVHVEGSAGSKEIKKNSKLDESLYNDINLKTSLYNIYETAEVFIPLFKRATAKIGNQTAWLYNENLFVNELHRIGGIRTLRGFDEESISASFYSVSTAEFRFLLDQNSALYTFFDYAYYEKRTKDEFVHDTPMSFGAGIFFSTKVGIFSMNYALGKQFNNPFTVKGGKVHFGFVNYF